jgi:hypothetical protein
MDGIKELKIEVGKKEGCIFNDKITIEITPSILKELVDIYEKRVMNSKNIYECDNNMDSYKKYKSIYFNWEEERENKDICIIKK